MTVISALPMTTQVTMTPDPNLDRPLYSTTIRWTWPGGDWTRFSLVRKMNSPARRREEGSIIFEARPDKWGEPVFEDQGAPPDRWAYYTAFVLNMSRIWVEAGNTYEMGTGDHDWTLNLPELLPGVSISQDHQVVAKADPQNDLVEFLQGPGLVYDRVISYGESAQYFWDPAKVPPNMLPALLNTLGFAANETLADDRLREVANALLTYRPHGSLQSIQAYAAAVMGVETVVQLSTNRMLSTVDSSFEGVVRTDPAVTTGTYEDMNNMGASYDYIRTHNTTYRDVLINTMPGANSLNLIAHSHWLPLDTTLLELRRYEYYPDPPAAIPVEVLDTFFLHFKKAGVIKCGETDQMAGAIPVSWWNNLRAGVFARGTGTHLTMRVDLYDFHNLFLRTLTPLPSQALTNDWVWYHTPDHLPLPVNKESVSVLGNPTDWKSDWAGKAQTQNYPAAVTVDDTACLRFTWNTNPAPSGDIIGQPPVASSTRLMPVDGNVVMFTMTVVGQTPVQKQSPWRLVIRWDIGAAKNTYVYHTAPKSTAPTTFAGFPTKYATFKDILTWVPPDRLYEEQISGWVPPSDKTQIADLEWRPPPDVKEAWFGIEALKPDLISNTYDRVRMEETDYADVKGDYATFGTVKNLPVEGGWSTQAVHTVARMEVGTGASGRAYWAVPIIEVDGVADIDLVVVDDV